MRHIRDKEITQQEARSPDEVSVGAVLYLYGTQHAPTVAAPKTIGYALQGLAPYWGNKLCSEVKGSTCREYSKVRRQPRKGKDGRIREASDGTIRKELGVLQAALNYAHTEGKILYAPKVSLVAQHETRERWLKRPEAAAVLAAGSPHVRRFTLIALATGSRSSAILGLRWGPSISSGWVDLENGIIHRKGSLERTTKKRRGSVKIPDRLLSHMRRWYKIDQRTGQTHVINWGGAPVSQIRTGFHAACERAGIADVTPHTLKHTAVTWAFQRGMTLEDAADWFDTTPQTLIRVYRQHSPEHQERARRIMQGRA